MCDTCKTVSKLSKGDALDLIGQRLFSATEEEKIHLNQLTESLFDEEPELDGNYEMAAEWERRYNAGEL